MLAYIIIGLILGAIAWQLKHAPGDPKPATQMIFGVGGAIVGGVGYNLIESLALMDLDWGGVLSASLVAIVVLVVLQVRVSA